MVIVPVSVYTMSDSGIEIMVTPLPAEVLARIYCGVNHCEVVLDTPPELALDTMTTL